MKIIFVSFIFALLFLQISFAQQDTEDVNIVVKKPSMCIEGKLYYSGGQQVYKCVNGIEIPHEYCPYGAVGDGEGGWKCGENPSPCVSEGKVVYEGEHCCGDLVENDDGVCIEKQGTSTFLIPILLVFVVLVVWMIARKKK